MTGCRSFYEAVPLCKIIKVYELEWRSFFFLCAGVSLTGYYQLKKKGRKKKFKFNYLPELEISKVRHVSNIKQEEEAADR